ncbi:hypothetical protein VP01_7851g3 [Puccinia sorghi]|uniref:Uncharacterized protein n=1 Tax=Puccinia sorghi TaxID=27349 RepID=A0A0L6UBV4_9BASI|nr:hypothetical protein VP01_7851g3 [Puccinia sorghi]
MLLDYFSSPVARRNLPWHQMELRSGSVDQWITAIKNLLGGGAVQVIEHILGTAAYGQQQIHIDLGQGPNGPSLGGIVIDPQQVPTRLAPGKLSCWPNFSATSHASKMVQGGMSISENHLLFQKSCQNPTGNLQPSSHVPSKQRNKTSFKERNLHLSSPHHSPHLPPQLRESQQLVVL